jgi:hypothetical protein
MPILRAADERIRDATERRHGLAAYERVGCGAAAGHLCSGLDFEQGKCAGALLSGRSPGFAKSADGLLRWLRLFGQVFRVFKWKNCSASRRRGCGNVKIGFIDFQGLVGRAENSSIVFRMQFRDHGAAMSRPQSQCIAGTGESYSVQRRRMSVALMPPKPKEFDRATSKL